MKEPLTTDQASTNNLISRNLLVRTSEKVQLFFHGAVHGLRLGSCLGQCCRSTFILGNDGSVPIGFFPHTFSLNGKSSGTFPAMLNVVRSLQLACVSCFYFGGALVGAHGDGFVGPPEHITT